MYYETKYLNRFKIKLVFRMYIRESFEDQGVNIQWSRTVKNMYGKYKTVIDFNNMTSIYLWLCMVSKLVSK